MENILNKQIGELVAQDYRTAAIFNAHGIDFCCRGNRKVNDVCDLKKINKQQLENQLQQVFTEKTTGEPDFRAWPLDLLADYIEKTHHRYVSEKSPVLQQFLTKLCKVHGERHPELFTIHEAFNDLAKELASHMKKEELILFPFIRKMINHKITHQPLEKPHFGSVENPINMMEHEHTEAGELLQVIEKNTNGYTPPADACNTYRVTFAMLKEFEEDLHKHIHLENNILFPKAIALEKEQDVAV
ncbi:iron-sulfur cluster repair di-iron protein [uncultured Mesonia sp.]|uniref:iron-sulfur cluster repair di-iron protein n=1 Tax=uncultured Mesonia sp. TaxID=399731 RepID=UPI00374EFC44